MKKLVVIAAALLVLTGCAAPTVEEAVEPETVQETEIAAAPLVAKQPEEEAVPSDPQEAFIQAVREIINPETTQIPDATDEQLLLAAQDACAQIDAGTLPDQVQVIEGEEANQLGTYIDSQIIGMRAQEFICES